MQKQNLYNVQQNWHILFVIYHSMFWLCIRTEILSHKKNGIKIIILYGQLRGIVENIPTKSDDDNGYVSTSDGWTRSSCMGSKPEETADVVALPASSTEHYQLDYLTSSPGIVD